MRFSLADLGRLLASVLLGIIAEALFRPAILGTLLGVVLALRLIRPESKKGSSLVGGAAAGLINVITGPGAVVANPQLLDHLGLGLGGLVLGALLGWFLHSLIVERESIFW